MSKSIESPSVELIEKYVNKFNNETRFVVVENVLSEIFEKYPNNDNLRDVVVKATILNSLYSTNIYAIVRVSQHITNQKIDAKLKSGSPEVVEEIAHININGKIRNHYSFATKYCHWHQPDIYPIYDSYVDQLLRAYNKEHNFMQFKQTDLRNYSKYKEIVDAFRRHYNLPRSNLKELDKFLWVYGREYVGKEK
jgi:hypothetical protein